MPAAQVLDLPLTEHVLSVFLLVLARTSAWVVVVPIFAAKGIPTVVRLGIAVGLSGFLTPLLSSRIVVPEQTAWFVLSVVGQVAVGLALGMLTGLVLAAVEVVGGMADYQSGFSYGAILDPVSGAQSAAFARLTSITFMTLLMVTEGYRTIFAGFVMSFRALPLDHTPGLAAATAEVLGSALSGVFVAALQIGAPLLGVLFLTEVALAIAGRFVPQANAMTVGLPIKSLVAMIATGTMLALLPAHVPGLVEPAVRIGGPGAPVSGEKTEKATPKKLKDLRKKGTVARSVELPQSVVLLVAVAMLPGALRRLAETVRASMVLALSSSAPTSRSARQTAYEMVRGAVGALGPLLAAVLVVSLLSSAVLSRSAPEPARAASRRADRLSPKAGVKRLVSAQVAVRAAAQQHQAGAAGRRHGRGLAGRVRRPAQRARHRRGAAAGRRGQHRPAAGAGGAARRARRRRRRGLGAPPLQQAGQDEQAGRHRGAQVRGRQPPDEGADPRAAQKLSPAAGCSRRSPPPTSSWPTPRTWSSR